ncbi:zf-HC2 domain-containing protein, partial [Streptomyces sp. NPDC058953]|uniref:zf-HC2 domain-containing protein n=1 Tax=Streptomyces sp. NPDC058953 TaxID=3346676 RepID=UPI003695A2E9
RARRAAGAPPPRSPGVARGGPPRARGVGPAVGKGWLGAVVAVVAGALALSYGAGFDASRPLLLALAPALPPAGVAVAYGRHTDPLHEIAAATPSGGLRLLLTRTAVVLAVSVTLLTATGALLPADGTAPGAAAWLLPALALTSGVLALGSWTGLPVAAAVLTGGWLTAALLPAVGTAPERYGERLAPLLGTAAQGGWAAAAVLCAGLLVLRRSTFDHVERV